MLPRLHPAPHTHRLSAPEHCKLEFWTLYNYSQYCKQQSGSQAAKIPQTAGKVGVQQWCALCNALRMQLSETPLFDAGFCCRFYQMPFGSVQWPHWLSSVLCTMQCSFCIVNVQSVLLTVHRAMCTVHFGVFIAQCGLFTAQCSAHCSAECAVASPAFLLQ